MAKWLRRLGHRVTVLTTSAYGTGETPAEEGVVRTADLQRVRARLHGANSVDALFDSDTYSGKPHLLSRVLVPEPLIAAWAPFARARALRLNRRERFDCVITSSPPESVHAVGRALSATRRRRGSRTCATLGPSSRSDRPSPPRAQRRLDEALERRWLTAADAVVCVSRPAADDLRARLAIEPALVPNGWDPDLLGPDQSEEATSLLDPDRISLVYTGRFGSYGRDPAPLVRALAELAQADPKTAARLELVVAGPLTDAEAGLMRTDVSPARIVIAGSLPRSTALALQRSADALLLLGLDPAHPAPQLQAVRVSGVPSGRSSPWPPAPRPAGW